MGDEVFIPPVGVRVRVKDSQYTHEVVQHLPNNLLMVVYESESSPTKRTPMIVRAEDCYTVVAERAVPGKLYLSPPDSVMYVGLEDGRVMRVQSGEVLDFHLGKFIPY